MTFFKELNTLLNQATLSITIAKKEGNLTVSVTPIAPEGVKLELKPLIFNGTPEELDAKFLETLKSPLQKTEQAFCNVGEFEKQLEEKKTEATTKKEKGKKTEKSDEKKEEKKTTTKADVIMGKPHPEPTLFEVPAVTSTSEPAAEERTEEQESVEEIPDVEREIAVQPEPQPQVKEEVKPDVKPTLDLF